MQLADMNMDPEEIFFYDKVAKDNEDPDDDDEEEADEDPLKVDNTMGSVFSTWGHSKTTLTIFFPNLITYLPLVDIFVVISLI